MLKSHFIAQQMPYFHQRLASEV